MCQIVKKRQIFAIKSYLLSYKGNLLFFIYQRTLHGQKQRFTRTRSEKIFSLKIYFLFASSPPGDFSLHE